MREFVADWGKVQYPDERVFAFNPNRVMVWTSTAAKVAIGNFVDEREPMNGVVEFDVSKYLQTMVSKDDRYKSVTIIASTTVDEMTYSFSFTLQVIWGAINIGERWNKAYTLRWWKGLPFTMEMYIPWDAEQVRSRYDGNTYVDGEGIGRGYLSLNPEEVWSDAERQVVIRVDDGVTSSVYDYMFDGTFTGIDDEKVHIYRLLVQDEDKCGVYLRWIDRHGWQRYWLFSRGQETTSSKPLEDAKIIHIDGYEYKASRYIGKEATRSVKLCATLVNDDELDMLEQLATSPVVDMCTGTTWVAVNIEGMSVARGGKDWRPLNDFECVMMLPEVISQKL